MRLEKPCTNCKETKPLEDFHRSAKASDGRASWCKQCANAIHRTYRKRNYRPEDKRRWQLKTRYGLTPDDVDGMLKRQEGLCAVCSKILGKFHIDHCHTTGVVRGLLCHRCNVLIGALDDAEWREKADAYRGSFG
jgi:hypothetical protein